MKHPKSIEVIGKRWMDSNGNTYHTATVRVDGEHLTNVPYQYGYGDNYEWNAAKAIEEAGLMPGREKYANGSMESAWRYFERHGVKYHHEAIDVPRKKDL